MGFNTIAKKIIFYNGISEYDLLSLCGSSLTLAIHKVLMVLEEKKTFINFSSSISSGLYSTLWKGDNKELDELRKLETRNNRNSFEYVVQIEIHIVAGLFRSNKTIFASNMDVDKAAVTRSNATGQIILGF